MISDRIRSSLRTELSRSLLAKVGLFLVVTIILVSMFAPFLAPHDPEEGGVAAGEEDRTDIPPVGFGYETTSVTYDAEAGEEVYETEEVETSMAHPLGTTTRGHDILSRLMYGARVSMLVGLIGAGIAVMIGVPYGLTAGYFGGRIDDALMRGGDMMLAFPSLILAIALVGVFRETDFHSTEIPDPFVWAAQHDMLGSFVPRGDHVASMPESFTFPVTVTLVVALVNWVWFARVARGEAMAVRQEESVKAARSLGAGHWRIIRQHVLPNSLTPVIVLATIQVAAIILLESALSYLGFSGTTLTWGYDIAQGQGDTRAQWWISTMPGLAIVFAVIGINLLGDWLRDSLDPNIEGEGGV